MSNVNEHTTKVTVQITTIKVVRNDDVQGDVIDTIQSHGKLTDKQCRQIAADNNAIFVSKEVVKNEHNVLTSDLLDIIK